MKINIVALREHKGIATIIVLAVLFLFCGWFSFNYEINIVPEKDTKKMLIQVKEEPKISTDIIEPKPIYVEPKPVKIDLPPKVPLQRPVPIEKPVINITIINNDSKPVIKTSLPKKVISKTNEARQMKAIEDLNLIYEEWK